MVASENVGKENVAALRRVFASIDTDGSGSLSVAELSALMGADASALMVAADTTRSGRRVLEFEAFADLVAPSEFFRQSRATFDVLDANRDGRVTRDEVEQWLMRQLGEAEAHRRATKLTGRWATEGGAYRGKAADEPVSFADFFLFVSQSSRSLPLLHALVTNFVVNFVHI
jgi:Ca2+-binding EF-hand superfamily protein